MSERIALLDDLHIDFVGRLSSLQLDLLNAGLALELYETVRTPFRQAALYAKGRTSPGPKATKAQPWESAHQYGLAADMVFKVDDKWTWEEPEEGAWKLYGELAIKHGLEQLDFEKPHIQLPNWRKIVADKTRWTSWSREQFRLWTEGR